MSKFARSKTSKAAAPNLGRTVFPPTSLTLSPSLLRIVTAVLCGIHASPQRQGEAQLLWPAPSPGRGFQDGVPAPFDGEAASEQRWPVAWEGPTVSFFLGAAEAFEGKRIPCCILSQGKLKAGGGQLHINSNTLCVFSFFKKMDVSVLRRNCLLFSSLFLPSPVTTQIWQKLC